MEHLSENFIMAFGRVEKVEMIIREGPTGLLWMCALQHEIQNQRENFGKPYKQFYMNATIYL